MFWQRKPVSPETRESKLASIATKRKELEDKRAVLDEALEELDSQVLALVLEIIKESPEGLHLHRTEEDETYMADDFEVGYHECPGPIKVCVYDMVDDPCRDFCIFCGLPEERK